MAAFDTFQTKKQCICEELTTQRNLDLGQQSNEEVTLFIQPLGPEFPISGDKDAFYPPDARRVTFTWGIYFLLSGVQRWMVDQCVLFAPFSSNFSQSGPHARHILVTCPLATTHFSPFYFFSLSGVSRLPRGGIESSFLGVMVLYYILWVYHCQC